MCSPFVCFSQNQSVILKYIYNELFLNLRKNSSFPDRARVVIPSSSLPLNKTGYAAALFKCLLYSPQQSPPSIHPPSSPFPLHFLSTFYSLCFLLCIGNFHCKSQVASSIFFIFKLLLPISSLSRFFFVPSSCLHDVHCTVSLCPLLPSPSSSCISAQRERSWEQTPFHQCKVRENDCC